MSNSVQAIEWIDGSLKLLDQRLLPGKEIYLSCQNAHETAQAIATMAVRGAPAIGITAAYGVVLSAQQHYGKAEWQQLVKEDIKILAQSRPTAVNLHWALQRMEACLEAVIQQQVPIAALLREAHQILQEDIAANKTMGDYGAAIIARTQMGKAILTHCNTGSLATGGYGTALGVIRTAYQQGLIQQVYANETRPWLQGARLTAWELMREQIPVKLIVDSAAAHLMQKKTIGWVIVGADRITANGDVANKIGTYALAVLAKYHNIPFIVVAPTSTIDLNLTDGNQIPIEERHGNELVQIKDQMLAPQDAQAYNPVFDVTPAALISAIVTEKGVIENLTQANLAALFKDHE